MRDFNTSDKVCNVVVFVQSDVAGQVASFAVYGKFAAVSRKSSCADVMDNVDATRIQAACIFYLNRNIGIILTLNR